MVILKLIQFSYHVYFHTISIMKTTVKRCLKKVLCFFREGHFFYLVTLVSRNLLSDCNVCKKLFTLATVLFCKGIGIFLSQFPGIRVLISSSNLYVALVLSNIPFNVLHVSNLLDLLSVLEGILGCRVDRKPLTSKYITIPKYNRLNKKN